MSTEMQQLRGTAAEWAADNRILDPGEIGFEEDTKIIKIGDGVTAWNDLFPPYLTPGMFTAKGDMIVASAAATPTRLARGTTGQTLIVQSDGSLAWEDAVDGSTLLSIIDAAATYETQVDAEATYETLSSAALLTPLWGHWSVYGASWGSAGTAPAIGNGSIVGAYKSTDHVVSYRIKITFGSTTTYGTGAWFFTIPATPNAAAIPGVVGNALFLFGGSYFIRTAIATNPSIPVEINLVDQFGSALDHTTEAWTAGNVISISGYYETS